MFAMMRLNLFVLYPVLLLLILGVVGVIILMVKAFKNQRWVGAIIGVVLLLGLSIFALAPVLLGFDVVNFNHPAPQYVGILPVAFLGLLILAGLIALFVKLFRKSPAAAIVLGLVVLLLPLYLMISVRYTTGHERADTGYTDGERPVAARTETAIWTPGIEDELVANVYPSRQAAVRSLGLRIDKPVRQLLGDDASVARIVLFAGTNERRMIEELGRSASETLGDAEWAIQPETAGIDANEIALRLDWLDMVRQPAPWSRGEEKMVAQGTALATVLVGDRQAGIEARFAEKPWIEDLSGVLNADADGRLIIAKSSESCMSEAEANRQAMAGACARIASLLEEKQIVKRPARMRAIKISPEEILEADLIVDRFVQSFEGSAGRIWRQALLLDISSDKLRDLAVRKAAMMHHEKVTWAKMVGSILGLLALIVAAYLFLNAATKGYYAWSLRIAGIVLAAIVIIIFLA